MNKYGKAFIPSNKNKWNTSSKFDINAKYNDRVFEVINIDRNTNVVKLRGCAATLATLKVESSNAGADNTNSNRFNIADSKLWEVFGWDSYPEIELKDIRISSNKFVRVWGNIKIYYLCKGVEGKKEWACPSLLDWLYIIN